MSLLPCSLVVMVFLAYECISWAYLMRGLVCLGRQIAFRIGFALRCYSSRFVCLVLTVMYASLCRSVQI